MSCKRSSSWEHCTCLEGFCPSSKYPSSTSGPRNGHSTKKGEYKKQFIALGTATMTTTTATVIIIIIIIIIITIIIIIIVIIIIIIMEVYIN